MSLLDGTVDNYRGAELGNYPNFLAGNAVLDPSTLDAQVTAQEAAVAALQITLNALTASVDATRREVARSTIPNGSNIPFPGGYQDLKVSTPLSAARTWLTYPVDPATSASIATNGIFTIIWQATLETELNTTWASYRLRVPSLGYISHILDWNSLSAVPRVDRQTSMVTYRLVATDNIECSAAPGTFTNAKVTSAHQTELAVTRWGP